MNSESDENNQAPAPYAEPVTSDEQIVPPEPPTEESSEPVQKTEVAPPDDSVISESVVVRAELNAKVDDFELATEKPTQQVFTETDIIKYNQLLDDVLTPEELSELREYALRVQAEKKKGRSDEEIDARIRLPISPDRFRRYNALGEGAQLLMDEHIVKRSYASAGIAQHQIPDDEGGMMGQSTPIAKDVGVINNAATLLAALSSSGFKTPRHIPMFSSGIRVEVHTPSNTDLEACLYDIHERKTAYGDATGGYYFSTDMYHIITKLAEHALAHVHKTNIAEINQLDSVARVEALMKIIPMVEIPQLLQGFGYTLHPKGYPLAVECTNRDCSAETEYNVNIGHSIYHLSSRLKPDLRRSMRKHKNNITIEEVQKYQSDFFDSIPSKVFKTEMGDDDNTTELTIVLQMASIHSYKTSSEEWVESIADAIDEFVGSEFATEDRRENKISSRIQYETLNRYIPYIKSISFGNAVVENTVDNRDAVREALTAISEFRTLTDDIVESIITFIADATVSIVGIALPKCPVCKTINEDTTANHKSLMIFDPVTLFLALRERKLTVERNIRQKKKSIS